MLTYTFSKREKTLLILLAVVLVGIAWYFFVFQNVTNEIKKLDNQISTVQSDITTSSAKIKKMHSMQASIEEYRAAGVEAKAVPDFDNAAALMEELNRIMSPAVSYTVSFSDPDTETSNEYVLRKAKITFGSNSVNDAETLMLALENSRYPCRIDEFSISDNSTNAKNRSVRNAGAGTVSSTVNITFFENKPQKGQ